MNTAIILHGMPSKEEYFNANDEAQSNKHWLPWLQRQLILKGVLAQTPEMPEPYEPVYESWCQVFNQFKVDENTMLIGHSLGAGFLVRWLSENKTKVGKVALVAPFLDPDKDEIKGDFFDFEIDPAISERAKAVGIFVSNDDDQEIQTSAKQIQDAIKTVEVMQIAGKGHFTETDMHSKQFPELLNWLI